MKPPLDQRYRTSVMRQITSEKRGGSGKYYPIEELAQRLEFEIEKQQEAFQKKAPQIGPTVRGRRRLEIGELKRKAQLLRRGMSDPNLTAVDLRIMASPEAFETFQRVLSAPEALIELEAKMREQGCPTILLNGPPSAPFFIPIRAPDPNMIDIQVFNAAEPYWVDFGAASRDPRGKTIDRPKGPMTSPVVVTRSLMPEAGNYDIHVIGTAIYASALEEVKAGSPHRIAAEIVNSVAILNKRMKSEEMRCVMCDERVFDIGKAAEVVVGVPDEGTDARGISAPICLTCAALDGKTKLAKLRASLRKHLPGSREIKPKPLRT